MHILELKIEISIFCWRASKYAPPSKIRCSQVENAVFLHGTRVGGAATPAECSNNAGNDARGDVLVSPRAVEKRGVLHLGRVCEGHGCKILPRLNLRKGAGEGGV